MRQILCCVIATCVLVSASLHAAPVAVQEAKKLAALARATAPSDPGTGLELAEKVALAQKAGDYYARAFALSREVAYAENAAGQYMRVFDWTNLGQQRFQLFNNVQIDQLRQTAVDWLKRGMELGSGRSYTDYGALLLPEGDVAGARAAFEKGAAKDIAVAHFYLGKMDARGDKKRALQHFERALARGYKPARDDVYDMQMEVLRYESDLKVMERGIVRLKDLHQKDDESSALNSLIEKYYWRSFLVGEKARGRRLPDFPLYLRACELDKKFNPQRLQAFYRGGYWTLHLQSAGEYEPVDLEGQIDDSGCASVAEPLPENIRHHFDTGGVAYLRFPTGTLVLDWRVKGKQIHLAPRPMREQLRVSN